MDGNKTSVTPNHPYWIPAKGWVNAGDLASTEQLQKLDGSLTSIQKVEHEELDAPVSVYNFEVEEFHTYYAGSVCVLVHNADYPPDAGGNGVGQLSNVDARKWYLDHEAQIPDLIDKNLPLEGQARQAFNLRNQFRTRARELMEDRALAESLNKSDPNLTWEQLIEKMKSKGYSGDDIYKAIIESAQRSRKSVNQLLGLDKE